MFERVEKKLYNGVNLFLFFCFLFQPFPNLLSPSLHKSMSFSLFYYTDVWAKLRRHTGEEGSSAVDVSTNTLLSLPFLSLLL